MIYINITKYQLHITSNNIIMYINKTKPYYYKVIRFVYTMQSG